MSFIDKLKSKLKSTSADDLIASLPGIRKQSKDFSTDLATLNRTSQAALTAAALKANALTAGRGDFDADRRDYELAVGACDRTLTDYRAFIGNYAGFSLGVGDVDEALKKAQKKEKDAQKLKQIDTAIRDLAAISSAAKADLKSTLIPALEKAVKDAKDVVGAAKKKFDKTTKTIEVYVEAALLDCKKATTYFNDIKKLSDGVTKLCGKEDIGGAMKALKALKDYETIHGAFDDNLKIHAKKIQEAAKVARMNEKDADAMIAPRLKKDYDAALNTYYAQAPIVSKLAQKASDEVKKLRSQFGVG